MLLKSRKLRGIIPAFVLSLLCACTTTEQALPTLVVLGETSDQSTTPTSVPIETVTRLDFWVPVKRMLTAGQPHVYTFAGNAGEDITLRVIGRETAPKLALSTLEGELIAEGDIIQALLSATGDYRVTVSADQSGEYELGLRYTNQANPLAEAPTEIPQVVGVPTPLPVFAGLGTFIAEIDHNQTIGGMFERPNEQHVYTFSGESGDYVTIELNRVSGEIDPKVTLYNDQGIALALDASSGENENAVLRNVRLPTDGIYTVQAESDAAGGYALRLLQQDAPSPVTPTVIITPTLTPEKPILNPTLAEASSERLRDHQPIVGIITAPEDVARHAFYAEEGTIFTVGIRPLEGSALIPRLELIDPSGVPVAAASGLTQNIEADRNAEIFAFTAAESGPYTAFITAEGETFGRYMMGYGIGRTWTELRRGEALPDHPNESRVRRSSVREVWFAYLVAGDLITASVTPLEGTLEPVLELIAPDGALLGIDRESGGRRTPQITGIRIAQTGMYSFRIWTTQTNATGDYALVWRYVDVAPTPTPPEGTLPVLTLNDVVADREYRFFPFQGRAGQRVRIRIIAEEGGDFDPVAVLLDPNAQIVAEGDDSDGSLNPLFEAFLIADGTYNVRVNGYQTGGAFKVIVEELF